MSATRFLVRVEITIVFFFQFTELLFLRLITLSDATRQMESVGGNETNKTTQRQRRRWEQGLLIFFCVFCFASENDYIKLIDCFYIYCYYSYNYLLSLLLCKLGLCTRAVEWQPWGFLLYDCGAGEWGYQTKLCFKCCKTKEVQGFKANRVEQPRAKWFIEWQNSCILKQARLKKNCKII